MRIKTATKPYICARFHASKSFFIVAFPDFARSAYAFDVSDSCYCISSVARTSLVKEGETGVGVEERVKRKFVVPEWAALKPRLSEREGSHVQEENEKEGGCENERKRKAGGGRRRKNESRETVDKGVVQTSSTNRISDTLPKPNITLKKIS